MGVTIGSNSSLVSSGTNEVPKTLSGPIYVDGAGPTFCSIVCYVEIVFTLFYIAFCKNKSKRYAYITWSILALVFGFIA